MQKLITPLFCLCFQLLQAQTTTVFQFHSDTLDEDRTIRIHLPQSFDTATTREYPLILALDGEYLFYALMGNSEVLTTARKIMPESIVVGIDQNYLVENRSARWSDCDYKYKSGELEGKGISFKYFIENELLPHLAEHYRVGKFKAIAGHSFTANYINYFLEGDVFSGFIAISPYIPESTEEQIKKSIEAKSGNSYYYLSTGSRDLSGHVTQISRQDSTVFGQIANNRFHYTFHNYENETHMSLVSRSAPDALTHLYRDYMPLHLIDEAEQLALLEEPDLVGYITSRYENIRNTYGIEMPYREDDLTTISWIIAEQEDWEQLKEIGDKQVSLFPSSVYGYYTLGLYEEKQNNLVGALEFYKKGYARLDEGVSNKEDFYEDVERVEALIEKQEE